MSNFLPPSVYFHSSVALCLPGTGSTYNYLPCCFTPSASVLKYSFALVSFQLNPAGDEPSPKNNLNAQWKQFRHSLSAEQSTGKLWNCLGGLYWGWFVEENELVRVRNSQFVSGWRIRKLAIWDWEIQCNALGFIDRAELLHREERCICLGCCVVVLSITLRWGYVEEKKMNRPRI